MDSLLKIVALWEILRSLMLRLLGTQEQFTLLLGLLLDKLADIAAATANTVDDMLAAMLKKIVTMPEVVGWLYEVIKMLLEAHKVGSMPNNCFLAADTRVVAIAEKTGFSVLQIIALIRFIIGLLTRQ